MTFTIIFYYHAVVRNVIVRSFPGATTDDIKDYCKPIAKCKPDVCIIHVGTNDLKNKDELSIVENIVEVKELIEKISPRTKTVISTLTNRYDSEELLFKVKNVNNKLKQLYPNEDLIDNDNLDQSSVNRGGLHLSRKGVIHLAYNVKQILSAFSPVSNPLDTEHPCPRKKNKKSAVSSKKSQEKCENQTHSRLIRNSGSKRGLLICSLNAP